MGETCIVPPEICNSSTFMMKITTWSFPGRQAQAKTTHVEPHEYMPGRIQMVHCYGIIVLCLDQYTSPLKRILQIKHSSGLNVARCLPRCWLPAGCLLHQHKKTCMYVCVQDHANISIHTRVKNSSNTRNLSLRISMNIFPTGGTTCHALAKLTNSQARVFKLPNRAISTPRLAE